MSWGSSIILCSPVQCCSTLLKIAAAFHSRDGSFLRTRHFCTQGTRTICSTLIYHHLSICKGNRFAIFPQTESCPSHTASVFLVNTLRPPPHRLEQLHFNSCFLILFHNCQSSSMFLLIFFEIEESEKCFRRNFGTSSDYFFKKTYFV